MRALGQNPTEAEVKRLVQTQKASDRVSFETFLPILQAVSSKKITDTADDFVEGLRHFDKVHNRHLRIDRFSPTRNISNTCLKYDLWQITILFFKDGNGSISSAELRHMLTHLGERMNEEDVEALIHGQEDSSGNINYEDFVKMVLAA